MTSILLLALRLGRWGIVGFSALAFVATYVQAAGFYLVAGNTAAERASFGASMSVLASQFTILLPAPIRPDTVTGYVEFRGINLLSVLFAIWALASATGAARGDEERGVVEAVLAAGVSRLAAVGSRMGGFAIGVSVASAFAAIGLTGGISGRDSIDERAVVEQLLLLIGLALSCYAISLLVAQVASPRNATAVAGAVLLTLFLVNSLSRTLPSLATLRWLSPFRYYEISQPLPPGGTFDLRALAVLLAISVIAGAAAAAAFAQRDIGSPLVRLRTPSRPPSYEASRNPLWRVAVLRGLYDHRLGVLAWTTGMAVLAVVFVQVTKTIVEPLLAIRALAPYFAAFLHGNVYASFLGFTWFNVAQLLFAAFAITQVARWSAEDIDGRLEIVLSQPRSRASVVLERIAVLTTGAIILSTISGVAVFYASRAQGINLDGSRLAAATLMLVPFALVFAAAGSLLASWNPRAAVGLLGGLAFASYLDTEVGAIFKLPLWVQDLSAFKLFGTPLVTGVDNRNLALLLLIATVGVGSSILAVGRRDIAA